MSDPIKAVERGVRPLARIAAIGGILAGLGVVGMFVIDNFWKPAVEVISVDYLQGVAMLKVNGKDRVLYQGSIIAAKFNWGVMFAGDGKESPERIELVKNELTYRIIDISKEPLKTEAQQV